MAKSTKRLDPIEMLRTALRNRGLLTLLVRREVVGRYRGSMMGMMWSFFHPLLLLAVFTIFFGAIFKVRWGGAEGTTGQFAANIFIGLILHGFLAECINRAPNAIVANPNFVKKVLFPLEILPCALLGAALFHVAISLAVLIVMAPLLGMPLHWTALLLPFVIAPLALMVLGLSWALASVGVFLRDAAQVTAVLSSLLLFASPVFYPTHALPPGLAAFVFLNPLTYPIEEARNLLFAGGPVAIGIYLAYAVASLLVAWAGFAVFQVTRDAFADVV